ncbi:MAG: AAA family ATPase [Pseudonocardiales bacterium]|nr:AAA family ATPase [Pseudonocardiales bacterium]
MAFRNAKLIAFDGTHASGKTTIIYAVAALLRCRGVHVTTLGEPARASPFVDDVVIHNTGDFDVSLELDIFAAHIPNILRAARSHDVVLADKTPTNVLAYCEMLIPIESGTRDAEMASAMDRFCRTWGKVYDAVFFCQDHYLVERGGDKYRARVIDLQVQADGLLRAEHARLDQPIIEMPRALDIGERARWVVVRMEKLGLIEGEY